MPTKRWPTNLPEKHVFLILANNQDAAPVAVVWRELGSEELELGSFRFVAPHVKTLVSEVMQRTEPL